MATNGSERDSDVNARESMFGSSVDALNSEVEFRVAALELAPDTQPTAAIAFAQSSARIELNTYRGLGKGSNTQTFDDVTDAMRAFVTASELDMPKLQVDGKTVLELDPEAGLSPVFVDPSLESVYRRVVSEPAIRDHYARTRVCETFALQVAASVRSSERQLVSEAVNDKTAGASIEERADAFENLVIDAQVGAGQISGGSTERLAALRRRDIAVMPNDIVDSYAKLDAIQLRSMSDGDERSEAALVMASVRSDRYLETLANREPDVFSEVIKAVRRDDEAIALKEVRKAVDAASMRADRIDAAVGMNDLSALRAVASDVAQWRGEDSRREQAKQLTYIAERATVNQMYREALIVTAPEIWAAINDEPAEAVAIRTVAAHAIKADLRTARLAPETADDKLSAPESRVVSGPLVDTKPIEEANVVERNVRSNLVGETDDSERAGQDAVEQARRADLLAAVERRHLAVDNKFYSRNRPDELAFVDHGKRLTSGRNDDVTVKSMLDIASSKGWISIEIKGDDVFKQRVWREAQSRGIDVKGYRANDLDRAHADIVRTINEVKSDLRARDALTVVERAARGKGYSENEISRVVDVARVAIAKRGAQGLTPAVKVADPTAQPHTMKQPQHTPPMVEITPQRSIGL